MNKALLWAAVGTCFTFGMTALGSAMVFLFRNKIHEKVQRVLLGFAAGVMIAASVWSLIMPAIERAEVLGIPGWIPAGGGLILGVLFLMGVDHLLPHLHPGDKTAEGLPTSWCRSTLMMLAVTLHNIPEGMAVGLAFALAAQQGGQNTGLYASAMALAIGMGIQNFPEGAAISLPLRQEGMSAWKAFLYGCASAIVEPVFGIAVVLVAGSINAIMPWLLAFAAGAMLYVVVEEIIPAAHFGALSNIGTLGVMSGFLIMMVLDVALG